MAADEHLKIAEAIRTAMKYRDVSQSQLAKAVGITQGAVNQILSGATKRSKYLPDIARFLGMNLEALMTSRHSSGLVTVPPDDPENLVFLTEVDMGYGMGGGTFVDDHIDQEQALFDGRWLRAITRSPPNLLFVARGLGDSMSPTILDNDTVLIDRGQRHLTQQDRVWALTYGELGMVKRVRRKPEGRYLLMSDNPQISAIDAGEDELNIVGRLVWIGRKI